MKTIAFLLIASFSISFSFAQVKLQDGTQVDIVTTELITSKSAKEGDQVIFQMAEDVLVDGKVVIKAGSVVKGQITEAEHAKILGKAGKLDFSLDYGKTVDGQNIRLRSSKSFEGTDKQGGVIAAAYFFAPLLFIKGKDVTIEKGKRFTVYVDRDYMINTSSSTDQLSTSTDSNGKVTSTTNQQKSNTNSLADELKKLKELFDSKALTQEEYEAAKKKLLNQ